MGQFKELVVGPQDPEGTSELTAKMGTHNKAHQLLMRHAKNYPAELTTAIAMPRDGARSEALDLEEVEEAARSVRGRRAFLDTDDEFLDAGVHGHSNARDDEDRVVVVLYRKPSGRSQKGIIPYAELTYSQEAFEKAEQVAAGGGAPAVLSDEESADAVRAAQEDAEEARRELEELRTELAESQELAAEPFEGYEEQNANDLAKLIKESGREEYGRRGLEQIAEYEESRDQPRKTVLEAVKDALSAQG